MSSNKSNKLAQNLSFAISFGLQTACSAKVHGSVGQPTDGESGTFRATVQYTQ